MRRDILPRSPDDRVTIHWVSPLPPLQTDIAHYTRRILPALASKADVVLWTTQHEWDDDINQYAIVRRFDHKSRYPMDFSQINVARNRINAIFFNIGNSWVFHREIYLLAKRIPGIVVMHDLVLQEFFRDLLHNKDIDRFFYINLMRRYYGFDAGHIAEQICETLQMTPAIMEKYPLFEGTMDRAVAALVHTRMGAKQTADRQLMPSYRLDLPFPVRRQASAERSENGPLRLLQFGHIGPNRRLVEIIQALGTRAEEIPFQFDILGEVWDRALIEKTIRDNRLEEKVLIHGFVPETDLDDAIAKAHLVFNLRYPSMGEASGSQLRIWDHAALSVVTRTGWYDELPDDCVIKIGIGDESREIAALLEGLRGDRAQFRLIAETGRRQMERYHTPDRYADGIVEIAKNFRQDTRDRLYLDACTGLLKNMPYEERLSGVLEKSLQRVGV